MATRTTCDKCGKTTNERNIVKAIKSYELCNKCLERVDKWLSNVDSDRDFGFSGLTDGV